MRELTARERNLKIALDHAYGRTFESCAAEFNIHPSRAHQIYELVLKDIGLFGVRYLSDTDVAMAIHSRYGRRPENNQDTPQSFYYDMIHEPKGRSIQYY